MLTIGRLLMICSSVADCWNRYGGTSANCWWSAVLLQTFETDTAEHWQIVGDLQLRCRLLKQIQRNISKLLVICSSVADCWRRLQPELKVRSVQVSFVDVTSLFSGTVSVIRIALHKQRCLFETSTVDPVTLLSSCHGGSESIGSVCFWNILPVIKGCFTCGH